jgi:two-component system LytT family response regulator
MNGTRILTRASQRLNSQESAHGDCLAARGVAPPVRKFVLAFSANSGDCRSSCMRTLIVDDEPIARSVLREELAAIDDIAIVGEAENGQQALSQILALHPDLVFLDLQMPGMGGLDVIANLKGGHLPIVVIVTAYDEYAIKAFEAGAIDYLLKPISAGRLHKTLERARALCGKSRAIAENIAEIANAAGDKAVSDAGIRKIVGRHGDEYILLDFQEVLAFQADGEVVWIITAKDRFTATQPLHVIQSKLQNTPFQRVHRNALVNVNHVRKFNPMSSQRWLLTLTNGEGLIVSKRQAHAVRRLLHW